MSSEELTIGDWAVRKGDFGVYVSHKGRHVGTVWRSKNTGAICSINATGRSGEAKVPAAVHNLACLMLL